MELGGGEAAATGRKAADDGPARWREAWRDFSQHTTIHGVDKITGSTPFTIRRLVWVVLVLAGTGLFMVQVINRTMYYFKWPINVVVRVNHNTTVSFPAVTICNQNTFRISEAAKHGMYDWLNAMYTHDNLTMFNYSEWGVANVSMDSVYESTAHQRDDFILNCWWKTRACAPDSFVRTVTDHGVCYTFNDRSNNEPLNISTTGAKVGLRLLLNLEQYERMRGPYDAGGLKILLHDRHQIPAIRGLGEAIPSGSYAFVGVQLLSVENLPAPYGSCVSDKTLKYFDFYSPSACQVDCLTSFVVERCRCRDTYMPQKTGEHTPVCDIANYTGCLLPTLSAFSQQHGACHCPELCSSVHYRSSITYGSASSLASDAATTRRYTALLGAGYRATRETAQRVTLAVRAENRADVDLLRRLGTRLEGIVGAAVRRAGAYSGHMARHTATLTPRLRYHDDRGLTSLLYIVEHDFVRGWTVFDERTFRLVTTGFFRLTALIRVLADAYANTSADTNRTTLFADTDRFLKASWYTTLANELAAKIYFANRAKNNLTKVHRAFSKGVPILTYTASPNRRYDMSYIYLPFLRHHRRETEYFNILIGHIKSLIKYISQLQQFNKDLYQTGSLDDDQSFHDALSRTEYYSRMYNYYRFLYESRVVHNCPAVVQKRIDAFRLRESTYRAICKEIDTTTSDVRTLAASFRMSWARIRHVIHDLAGDFIENVTVTRLQLCEAVTSPQLVDDVQRFRTVYSDLRRVGQRLADLWRRYGAAHRALWASMLGERALDAFYLMMHHDVLRLLAGGRNDSAMVDTIATMLRTTPARVLSFTPDDLIAATNADFADINRTRFYRDMDDELATIAEENDIVALLGEEANEFTDAIEEFQRKSTSYIESTVVDSKFFRDNFVRIDVYMRELHYQEIIQQEDYGIIALLSDIGGSMGLFIGASLLTVFEIIDVVIHTACKRYLYTKKCPPAYSAY